MKIEVEFKTHYGSERIYPLTFKKELYDLTGCKTLTRIHIETLKKMGFIFEVGNSPKV